MTLERINARLLEDARKEAERLVEVAGHGIKLKLDREKQLQKERLEKRLETLRKELEEEKGGNRSLLNARYKKQILESKNNIIDRLFQEAADSVLSLDRQEYLALLEEWLDRLSIDEKAELALSSKDLRGIGPELVRKANDSCSEDVLFLATSAADIKGGFILKTKTFEIDRSLECVLSQLREDPISEVVEKLFGR
ncbi:MAG: V-type ATP synthase subunit E [Candidatus Brocadiales bacterium]|nr:V-type ATP synthase subunit E [Candidatus Bathyanammoxibius sp.]